MGDKEKQKQYYDAHAESYKASHKKYMEQYVEIKTRMTKEKRDAIKAHAELMGESASHFINRAIDETMERDLKHKTTAAEQKKRKK